ncbi:hypothetical protein INT44_007632 [Umbelopsis vinacea]|uniref:DUF8032 domain-containing protein n=1 Tax=Umbelopsis vinacea TaxID=44442 RepID=A0A8H7PKH5_9FUNG|nr:hypothetical protein INT44_007632 [Umbelopsis vinacea]
MAASNTSSTVLTPAEVLAKSQFGLFPTAPYEHDPYQPLLEDQSAWMMMNMNSTPVRHLSMDRGRPAVDIPQHRRHTLPADLSNMFDEVAPALLPTTEMDALTLPGYYPAMFVDASPPFMDTSGPSSLHSSLQPSLQSSKASSRASSPKTTSSASSVKPAGRRKSSHSSVAAAVALTVHEPTTHFINDIEHLTFMYSHDRHIKQYTIRVDIDDVDLNDIDDEFRLASAVYPRANVPFDEYTGNRWEYETSCNKLGWQLAHKNCETLFGRRGLIQRAVDSYRNRHRELRSRRVTRQEKIANGTLRKRQAKRRKQKTSLRSPSAELCESPDTSNRPKRVGETITISHPKKGSRHRICFVINDIPPCASSRERYKLYSDIDLSQNAQYREWCNEVSWRLVVKNPSLANDELLLESAVNECIRRKSPSELQQLAQTEPLPTNAFPYHSHFDSNHLQSLMIQP